MPALEMTSNDKYTYSAKSDVWHGTAGDQTFMTCQFKEWLVVLQYCIINLQYEFIVD